MVCIRVMEPESTINTAFVEEVIFEKRFEEAFLTLKGQHDIQHWCGQLI